MECGLCMACPECKRRVDRDEEHVEGCSDRAYIRGCDEPAYVVVKSPSGFEFGICKTHFDESSETAKKDFVRFAEPSS